MIDLFTPTVLPPQSDSADLHWRRSDLRGRRAAPWPGPTMLQVVVACAAALAASAVLGALAAGWAGGAS